MNGDLMSSPALSSSTTEDGLRQLAPERLRSALANFLPKGATAAEQTHAIETALGSPAGQAMRDTMAQWIVDEIVPVERLVPQAYIKWRPPVRDAMMFVVARLRPPVLLLNSSSSLSFRWTLRRKCACCG